MYGDTPICQRRCHPRQLHGCGVEGFEDGPASSARFHSPSAIRVGWDDEVFVGDRDNHRIRKIEGLGSLAQLKELWLGKNKITKIENLENHDLVCLSDDCYYQCK